MIYWQKNIFRILHIQTFIFFDLILLYQYKIETTILNKGTIEKHIERLFILLVSVFRGFKIIRNLYESFNMWSIVPMWSKIFAMFILVK